MTKTLIDPTKGEFALLDIIETDDGRRHQRNDGELFKLAEENQWYVLATVFGEKENSVYSPELDEKNRRAWNGWACAGLTDADRLKIAEQMDEDVAELSPLSDKERAEVLGLFQKRMGEGAKLPEPNNWIELINIAFLKPVGFEKRYFPAVADFSSSHFAADTYFMSSHFAASAYFSDSHFAASAYFMSSHFAASADFMSSHFADSANFMSSHFAASADFSSSHFAADTYFRSSHFAASAYFSSSHFAASAYFSSSHFAAFADFSSVKMLAKTGFQDAIFKTHVPMFHGADLYSDTVFPTDEPASQNYPPVPKKGEEEQGDEEIVYMSASEQKRAYNRLRYFMNQNLEIDQELFFHRREMACKEVTEEKWINRLPIRVYGFTSDYGSSIAKPLIGLGVNLLFGIVWLSGWLVGKASDRSLENIAAIGAEAFGWSFSNVFAFFRFGNLFYGKDYYAQLHELLQFLAACQTVFGFIFIFLLGLGIRSRFRLR